MKRLLAVAAAVVAAGCATVRSGGAPPEGELDRVAIARCAHDGIRSYTRADLAGLAGAYRLSVTLDDELQRASGGLVLGGLADGGPAPERNVAAASPILTGTTDIDLTALGARVPGDAASRDPDAPGVGLFAWDDGTGLAAVLRLGSEANRLDRQRFDGAHTTLRIEALGEGRFGGTWTSAEGAERVGGEFCATLP